MNHLNREIAPLTDAAWEEIDTEARHTLSALLAARRLVDLSGPHGWTTSAVDLGRVSAIEVKGVNEIHAGLRRVLPLTEIRVPFTLPREELAAISRGAQDADLSCVTAAAKEIARCEDMAVFCGLETAQMTGIVPASPHETLTIDDNYENFAERLATAISLMTERGIDGPFAVAMNSRNYTALTRATQPGGYPIIEHVQEVISGELVTSPLVEDCVVLSQRGGDFRLTIGQDFSIGYLEHSASDVRLYIEESFTFEPLAPEAAVVLQVESGGAAGAANPIGSLTPE